MNVPVIPLQLPIGYCPVNYQDLWNTFANNSQVTIPDALSQIVWQTTSPSDQTVSWGKLDSFGRPQGIYRFAQGAWLSPHPLVPGLTQWWFSGLPDFTSFDGGDSNPLSSLSGPMWQLAVDPAGNVIGAKFPIAAGSLPSGAVLSSGQSGGEENHTLLVAEMPSHIHNIDLWTKYSPAGGTPYTAYLQNDGSTLQPAVYPTQAAGGQSSAGNPTAPHNNMPPYIVGYLIQRTARQFYVG